MLHRHKDKSSRKESVDRISHHKLAQPEKRMSMKSSFILSCIYSRDQQERYRFVFCLEMIKEMMILVMIERGKTCRKVGNNNNLCLRRLKREEAAIIFLCYCCCCCSRLSLLSCYLSSIRYSCYLLPMNSFTGKPTFFLDDNDSFVLLNLCWFLIFS